MEIWTKGNQTILYNIYILGEQMQSPMIQTNRDAYFGILQNL